MPPEDGPHPDELKVGVALGCVCALSHEHCFQWAQRSGIDVWDIRFLARNPKLMEEVERELTKVGDIEFEELSAVKRVAFVQLTPEAFTVENGLVTNAYTLRRSNLEKAFPPEQAWLTVKAQVTGEIP